MTPPPYDAPPAGSGASAIRHVDTEALARAVHDRINVARRAASLAPLAWDAALANLAAAHSADMARRGYFAHTSPEGVQADERAAEAGLSCKRSVGRQTFVGFGENLYMTASYRSVTRTTGPAGERRTYDWKTNDDLAREAVQGWLGSPPHRANLLSPTYAAAGLGVAVSGTGDVYMTQVFC